MLFHRFKSTATNEILHQKRKLLYNSRKRGILETDLILSTWAQKNLNSLGSEQLDEYERLLDENDWDIYYWATGAKPVPSDIQNLSIFDSIYEHAKNKDRKILRMPDL